MKNTNLFEETIHNTIFCPIKIYDDLLELNKVQNTDHYHHEFEMIYVIEGDGILNYENQPYSVKNGDLIFIKPNIIHSLNPTKSKNLKRVSCVFNLDLISSKFMDYSTYKYIAALYSQETDICFILDQNKPFSGELQSIMENIYLIYLSRSFCFELSIKINLLKIFEILFKNNYIKLPNKNSGSVDKESQNLEKIITYMNENFKNDISLDMIAKQVYYNKFYLLKFFKRKTRMSCIEYITMCRLNYAASLLIHTDKTVTSISSDSGFNSTSFFIKTFKNRYNKTPNEFRQLNKELIEK